MTQPVIRVEKLSKAYRLGQIGTGTLTNDLRVWWAKVRGNPNPILKIGQEDHGNLEGEMIWALEDINFKVEQGEVLGIIGRNGAGKSTLLKILSQVTSPTKGCVKLKGRIASLLEVGTGFHPDLTGQENIYLNGAILGMSKEEVRRKFDEIVSFAEVEKFIDTPVKRYSSGMYVRLAFAVAAHLEPEILLVDEVLAVGDLEFQKKCLGKMGDVAKEGRTVIFVSHNMASIRSLCNVGILLSSGKLIYSGNVVTAISKYSENNLDQNFFSTNDLVEFKNISINCEESTFVNPGKPFIVSCDIKIKKEIIDFKLFCIIKNGEGQNVVHSEEKNQRNLPALCAPGIYKILIKFPCLWLKPSIYSLNFKFISASGKKSYARFVSDNIILDVNDEVPPDMLFGSLTPLLEWELFPSN